MRDKRWADTAALRVALAAVIAGKSSDPAAISPAQAARWDDRSSTAKVDLPGVTAAKSKLPLVLLLVAAVLALLVGVGAVWYL